MCTKSFAVSACQINKTLYLKRIRILKRLLGDATRITHNQQCVKVLSNDTGSLLVYHLSDNIPTLHSGSS